MNALDIIFIIVAILVIILSLLQGGKSEGAFRGYYWWRT